MGILDRARRSASRAVGRAVGNAVGSAVETGVTRAVTPVVTQAAAQAGDQAGQALSQAAGLNQQTQAPAVTREQINSIGGMFASLQSSAQSYANEAAKNMKLCPNCGEPARAELSFCPQCGTRLPEKTLAAGALCPGCGRQNDIGTKFCAGCGAKLPAAIEEEEAARARDEAVLARWETALPQFPRWCFGGSGLELEEAGADGEGRMRWRFSVCGVNADALRQYRALLGQHGFVQAGKYPSEEMLYKMVGTVCWCFESCEPFPGDPDTLCVSFCAGEPQGGFNYKKPEIGSNKIVNDVKSEFKSFFKF